MTVTVPKAAELAMTLSCGLDADRLGELSLVAWRGAAGGSGPEETQLRSAAAPGDDAQLRANLTVGAVPAVSETMSLAVVHAVEKPLSAPTFTAATAIYPAPGATAVELAGAITVDARSTHQVDVYATFSTRVDPGPANLCVPPGPMPATSTTTVHVASLPVDGATTVGLGGTLIELGTLATASLKLTAVATSAFNDYFGERFEGVVLPAPVADLTLVGAPLTLAVPAREAPHAPVLQSVIPTWA